MTKNIKKYSLTVKETDFPTTKITTSNEAYDVIKKFYHEDIEIYESSFLLMLNKGNKTTGYAKISQGGIIGTVVDTRLVAKYAVESLATSVIIAHNHPSGNLMPSEQDIKLTKKLKQALETLEIHLYDHLILTAESYYSLADNCLI